MVSEQNPQSLIEEFISAQVISRGLDERTARAYRFDLGLLFRWMKSAEPEKGAEAEPGTEWGNKLQREPGCSEYGWEKRMEAYLEHLVREQGRRSSTICRKHLVFGYYLSYLKSKGLIRDFRPLHLPKQTEAVSTDAVLTKREVDAFFQAIHREYESLDSDFRRRICLRDQVMMGLLFYCGIEVSELLRLEVADYDLETATLLIRRKREKSRRIYLYSPDLQSNMEQWLAEHGHFEHGEPYRNRLFLSKLGKPLSMKMVINIFDKYRGFAGIERECTPKDLKNSLSRYGEEMVRERDERSGGMSGERLDGEGARQR